MPIFDQGYQHWRGSLSGHAWRWWTVTLHGVRTVWKGRLVKLTVLVALAPALVLAAIMCLWGLVEQRAAVVAPLLNLLSGLPAAVRESPHNFRVPIWTLAFFYFFQVQTFLSMILVLLVGPNLISQDLRFNAVPLYLSKPVRRIDYFLGKFGVIAVFLGAVAVMPSLVAYVLGLCFSLDLGVMRATWRVLAAALAYGCIIVLSAGALMLALSSLSRNSRYVGMMWIGMWIVSGVTAGILTETVRKEWCPLISYTGNLSRLGEVLLDTESAFGQFRKLVPQEGSPPGRLFGPRPPGSRPGRESGLRFAPPPPPVERPPLPTAPWPWSALTLGGAFGISLWVLTFRVKSLDRLR
jgi:ABC-2 type transport system permease protein